MNYKHQDALQSIAAQVAHINNRIIQMACRGYASESLMLEIAWHANSIADTSNRLAKEVVTNEN